MWITSAEDAWRLWASGKECASSALGSSTNGFPRTMSWARKEILKTSFSSRCAEDVTTWLRISDRKSTRLNSSHLVISYAVFCLKKKKNKIETYTFNICSVCDH